MFNAISIGMYRVFVERADINLVDIYMYNSINRDLFSNFQTGKSTAGTT